MKCKWFLEKSSSLWPIFETWIVQRFEQNWNSWRLAFEMQTYYDLTKSSWRQFLQLKTCKWFEPNWNSWLLAFKCSSLKIWPKVLDDNLCKLRSAPPTIPNQWWQLMDVAKSMSPDQGPSSGYTYCGRIDQTLSIKRGTVWENHQDNFCCMLRGGIN